MIGLLGDIALVTAFAGCAVFVVRYGALSGWWRTSVGRNMLAFMGVCMVLLGLSTTRMVFGDEWFEAHRDALRLVSFGLVSVVVWWRVVLLVKVQRRDKADRARPNPAP